MFRNNDETIPLMTPNSPPFAISPTETPSWVWTSSSSTPTFNGPFTQDPELASPVTPDFSSDIDEELTPKPIPRGQLAKTAWRNRFFNPEAPRAVEAKAASIQTPSVPSSTAASSENDISERPEHLPISPPNGLILTVTTTTNPSDISEENTFSGFQL